MSDYDRGAYAPYHDASLSLDGYGRPPRARAPLPMALIGSIVVLLLLGTAAVMFYRSGSKSAASMPRPVGGGIAVIKSAPSGPQPIEPGAGLEVYSPQNVPSANTLPPAPQFAPAPEKPVARPPPPPAPVMAKASPALKPAAPAVVAAAPVKQTVEAKRVTRIADAFNNTPRNADSAKPAPAIANAAQARARDKPPATTPAHMAEASLRSGTDEITTLLSPAAKPVAAKTAKTDKAAAPVKLASAKRATVEEAAAPESDSDGDAGPAAASTALPKGPLAPTKPTLAKPARSKLPVAKPAAADATPAVSKPAPNGGYSVQVGAFASADMAQKGFTDAARKAGDATAGKSRSVQTVQKDGKTYYRSNVGGFASRAEAAAYCAAVRAKGGPCAVH